MYCHIIYSEDEIRKRRKELMKEYPSPTVSANVLPMGADSALDFAMLCVDEEDGWLEDFRLKPDPATAMPGLIQLLASRFSAAAGNLLITWPALIAGATLAPSPGPAYVFLCDLLEQEKHRPPGYLITTQSVVNLYPGGFWNETVLAKIVDQFMKTGVHPFSFVYGINMIEAVKIWGGGVHNEDWSWPIG